MRLLVVAGAVALGVVTGVAATMLHDRAWGWWALAVAGSLAAGLAVRAGWPRLGFGVGWLLVVWLAASPRPEGDYLVGSGPRGLAFLGVALLLLVVCVTTIPVRRRRSAAEESEDRATGT